MRNKTLKTILCLVLVFLIGVCATFSFAADYQDELSETLSYLYNSGIPEFGSIGGEWKVLAIARGGYASIGSNYFNEYYTTIESIARDAVGGIINENKVTENARVIIALSSIGRNAETVADVDLVAPLSNMQFVSRQGINGVVFSLIAVDTYQYSCAIRNDMVTYILNRQQSSGGWAISGTMPDPDITAMAITALAPYRQNASVSVAINKAVDLLSQIQCEDGGYESFGAKTSESCAQVIVALSTIGINADSDERFSKNGTSVLDALLSFYTPGGGFEHISGGGRNAMATEQAAYALVSYRRFEQGRNTLYDMRDVAPSPSPIITDTPTNTPHSTIPALTPTPQMPTGEPSSPSPTAVLPTATVSPSAMSTLAPVVTAMSTSSAIVSPSTTDDAMTTKTPSTSASDIIETLLPSMAQQTPMQTTPYSEEEKLAIDQKTLLIVVGAAVIAAIVATLVVVKRKGKL